MPRVHGKVGVGRFRIGSYFSAVSGDGLPGTDTMTRIAAVRIAERLPTQAGTFTPVWSRSDGATVGWNMLINGNTVSCSIGTGAALPTATGAVVLNAGKWYTLGFTYDGATVRNYVNGVPDGTVAAAGGITVAAANDETVGAAPDPTPTIHANGFLEVYGLIGSETVQLDAAAMLAAHNTWRDHLERGRDFSAIFTGQDTCFDGDDAFATQDAAVFVWADRLDATHLLGDIGDPERVFTPVRF